MNCEISLGQIISHVFTDRKVNILSLRFIFFIYCKNLSEYKFDIDEIKSKFCCTIRLFNGINWSLVIINNKPYLIIGDNYPSNLCEDEKIYNDYIQKLKNWKMSFLESVVKSLKIVLIEYIDIKEELYIKGELTN